MLTIRREQLKVFSQADEAKFEAWMLAHLNNFFPRQCAALGGTKLRETIKEGIKRAAAYEIVAKSDVCKYIDLMVVFGRDFDSDKRFPWAAEILKKRKNPSARIQALFEAAQKHLNNS